MPLADIELSIAGSDLPGDIRALLDEADSRLDQFARHSPIRINGFVPSDFVTVYRALRAIVEENLAPGDSFCEWGSGFGVVAATAAMLEFDACGIEIESSLVDASRKLACDFGLPVEFVHGSFIPPGGEVYADNAFAESGSEFFWLATDADNAYGELRLDPDDFDVVFAYPWPGEERVIESLFQRYAAEGALLLTYNEHDSIRLRRKVGGRKAGKRCGVY